MSDPTPHKLPDPPSVTRRQLLQIGSLGVAGLTLPELLAAESQPARPQAENRTRRPAKACIFFFMEGGPSHIDLWDMKPHAPAEFRGEFRPVSTTVPGLQVCEHQPMLAQQMHHLAVIRSVHHKVVDHNAGAYYTLTGRSPFRGNELIVSEDPDNFPPYGSVLARLQPIEKSLPPFVHLPYIMANNGYDLPGQKAGFLGGAYDPLVIGDPSVEDYRIPGLSLPGDVSERRLRQRRELLERINQPAHRDRTARRMSDFRQQAFDLLCAPATRHALDLSAEPRAVRERYGMPAGEDRSVGVRKFGGLPHMGQCMLMARRLVEAGVRLVTVGTGRRYDQSWDTHRTNFSLLKRSLLPYADRAFSALLADLHERGMLEETLVVAMGEFGRTPRVGQITSSAGAGRAGRDHWPHCYTVLLAGGGIRGGAVFGASDRLGAYPKSDPVTPEDIAATIYRAMGIDAETRIYDQQQRPSSVALGEPIERLFG